MITPSYYYFLIENFIKTIYQLINMVYEIDYNSKNGRKKFKDVKVSKEDAIDYGQFLSNIGYKKVKVKSFLEDVKYNKSLKPTVKNPRTPFKNTGKGNLGWNLNKKFSYD